VFFEIMGTLKGFSKNDIDSICQIITTGEGGHLNQGCYHEWVFLEFFKDRDWVWPEFQQWEGASRHSESYPLLIRTLVFRASSLHGRKRQLQSGTTHAIWMHSGAGVAPRSAHVAFSGHMYEVARGAFLEGKWTWPGVEIDCKCMSRPVIPGFT
jgi:hypothetical protein